MPMSYVAPITTEYWDDDGSAEYRAMFGRIEQEGIVLEGVRPTDSANQFAQILPRHRGHDSVTRRLMRPM